MRLTKMIALFFSWINYTFVYGRLELDFFWAVATETQYYVT